MRYLETVSRPQSAFANRQIKVTKTRNLHIVSSQLCRPRRPAHRFISRSVRLQRRPLHHPHQSLLICWEKPRASSRVSSVSPSSVQGDIFTSSMGLSRTSSRCLKSLFRACCTLRALSVAKPEKSRLPAKHARPVSSSEWMKLSTLNQH